MSHSYQIAICKLICETSKLNAIVSLNMRKALLLCLGTLALTGCTVFGQSFTCDDEPSTREEDGNQIVSCYSPEFLITCDSKTVTIVDDVLRCKSADGTSYKVANRRAQEDKRCTRKLGEQGIYDAEKKDCDCSYPYFLKNGRCENLTEECTAKYGVNGSVEGDGTCGCTIGYVLKNEQCVSVDGICKAQFGEGAERVEFDDTKCQCGTGYQWNEAGDKCVCVKDHHLEGGTCVKSPFCGWGSYNPETKKCVCDKGTIMKNGSCSKPSPLECGYSGTFNTETGRCDCDHGYYEKNGKCTYIPYCGDGNFNTKTEQCDCEEGATLRNGICNKPFGL
jgi:hypothetical protein